RCSCRSRPGLRRWRRCSNSRRTPMRKPWAPRWWAWRRSRWDTRYGPGWCETTAPERIPRWHHCGPRIEGSGPTMRILITGGGGFLGSRLAQALAARDPAVKITLLDVAFPNAPDPRFTALTGDLASP